MITPKFREIMVRVETERFIIRLWFSPTVMVDSSVVVKSSKRMLDQFYLHDPKTPVDAENLIEASFSPDDGLAASEVLVRSTLHGLVSYFEWP